MDTLHKGENDGGDDDDDDDDNNNNNNYYSDYTSFFNFSKKIYKTT